MRNFWLSNIVLLVCSIIPTSAHAGSVLELKAGDDSHVGKLVVKNDEICWLMGRDGKLARVELDSVTDFKKVSPTFNPLSASEMRSALQKDFGKKLEVAGSQHYLVVAPRGSAQKYADLFEGVYRNFHAYFSVRKFRIPNLEFPLVAMVFPTQREFVEYCRTDGITPPPGMMGYYLRTSNRVALFETGNDAEELLDTLVHEGTHQVACNTGLHSRIGENSKWIVEGLATVFEAPGIRNGTNSGSVTARINHERFAWFGNYSQTRRETQSLAKFVSDDALFMTNPLDAYSQAWALSFFLVETRPAEYARYLKRIADRDAMRPYGPDERLADFRHAFGGDLKQLEAQFLRFVNEINLR